ncbi:hypothetical protein ACJMK2_026701 [Sinanodonta woodiana]|uniref:Uncharacterized protein n=1 Tax=Sinanodonta woodiana TaxID=1069815 RepID=A0ABD3XP32_SINWO
MVIGGSKVTKYQLRCSNVRLGGADISETANIKPKNNLDLTKVYQKEAQLSMILMNKDNETLDSTSIVVIGEELRLLITANSE